MVARALASARDYRLQILEITDYKFTDYESVICKLSEVCNLQPEKNL